MVRAIAPVGALLLLITAGAAVAGEGTAAPVTAGGSAADLPLSEIVLFSSGVGYFQRDGIVDGRRQVELRFRVEEVNDLLKSLVVQDLDGGRVGMVAYDSRDPIAKRLKSFAVDLTANLTLGQLLERLRGEAIEIAAPSPVRGVIVSVEKKRESVGERETRDVEYVNLMTAEGLRAIPLTQVQRIALADGRLDAEVRQALQVLASAHDTRQKSVRLDFDGVGRRRVRVAYVTETPVWKTSYRLALAEGQPPFLQGWAIVENTTDEDWNDVRLSLVSGRPISFAMDLYEPLYARRPVVVPELYQSLRPQVHEQAVEEARPRTKDAPVGGAPAPATAPPMVAAPAMRAQAEARAPAEVPLERGVVSAAQGAETGELFRYRLDAPVSLARQRSAMLPIVNEAVAGVKLSIYNERVNAKHPLNGFRLKNATSLHLLQGPITVFDGGIYAGDARLADLPPGQERLLSYALDLETEVEPQRSPATQELVGASLKKGLLIVTRRAVEERIYLVKSRNDKPKTVLVEHPFRADWRLVEPAQATERSRDLYRFEVPVAAAATARLAVREERRLQESVRLLDTARETIGFYLQAGQVSAAVKEALRKAVDLRDRLDQTVARRSRLEQRVKEIAEEQARIRENMGRLPQSSDLYARYVMRLGQQETEIEGLRRDIETQRSAEERQRRELTEYLLGLDLDA
jgi:hypothetical protein